MKYIPKNLLESNLRDVEAEISELESRRDRLLIKREAYQELLGQVVTDSCDSSPRPDTCNEMEPVGAGAKALDRPRSTTGMILEFLSRTPGKTMPEIVDALQNQIDTSSPTPRRVVRNSLLNLHRRGQIKKNEDDGTFHPRMNGKPVGGAT